MEWLWVGRRWKWVPMERVLLCGEFWRGGSLYEVVVVRKSVVVTCFGPSKMRAKWRVIFVGRYGSDDAAMERERMASKWIAAAIGKRAKKSRVVDEIDPVLGEKRPALTEFMTELEGEKGKEREPSVLMVAVTTDGIKVGLKDEQAGGWVWRVGDTFKEALDAVEKALQSGGDVFRSAGGRLGKKK